MVNDSAGVDVILIDKSQRAASATGFKAAVAIETERGLCNTPTFIASSDDFVKVFGNSSLDKYGQANVEAYYLAQNGVPMVISRAKNPNMDQTSQVFGCLRITIEDGKLVVNADAGSNAIRTPADKNTSCIYFKGEGDYCSKRNKVGAAVSNASNIVVRFSEPPTESAYADKNRALQLQVFDFGGSAHIDENQDGKFDFTPSLAPLVDTSSSGSDDELVLEGYELVFDNSSGVYIPESNVVVFVNGRRGEAIYSGGSIYDAIVEAVLDAKDEDGKQVLSGFMYDTEEGRFVVKKNTINCFNLSISITITATAAAMRTDGGPLRAAYYNFGCGSVAVVPSKEDPDIASATFSLATSLYLSNRNEYMYMGKENDFWATYYNAYLRENYIVSFSYNDYDSSYVSMQIDSVLAGSNYLVARTNDIFEDYKVSFPSDDEAGDAIVTNLTYFDPSNTLLSNAIEAAQRSYAYAEALREIASSNLTVWRCVVTANLGDAMNQPDFLGVIEAASETTLGVSNIGKAASLDVANNTSGRHGNRFIADYSQYGLRNIAGRRTWVTMACLITQLLNTNYDNGNEARPPMGFAYGQVICSGLSQEFSGKYRKQMVQSLKVNPIISEGGFFAWEEVTSQLAETALSDIHVILSFCWMKYEIAEAMRSFVAEYNDAATVASGLRILQDLCSSFISRNYIEEGMPNADKNVIGDKVLRFDFPVRFKGVARYVDVYVTAYPQTQDLAISLQENA